MHTIVIASRRKYFHPITGSSIKVEYRELERLDEDEFDLEMEINKLMDMLNNEQDPAIQEFARARCKFLGWKAERVYDPSDDYYADDLGWVWCITGVNYYDE